MQVRLYGDSLSLPRKGYVCHEQRYITLFQEWIEQKTKSRINLIDRSKSNSLITQLYSRFNDDNSYFEQADIIIIHEGVCDCAPRPLPNRIRNLISKLPTLLRSKIIKVIHNNRAFLLKNGFNFVQIKPDLFYRTYLRWLSDLKNSKTKVLVLNIAPTNRDIENQSPGFTSKINLYNSLIEKAVNTVEAQNVFLINMNEIISNLKDVDTYIIKEDGHHITAQSHLLYFNQLRESYSSF